MSVHSTQFGPFFASKSNKVFLLPLISCTKWLLRCGFSFIKHLNHNNNSKSWANILCQDNKNPLVFACQILDFYTFIRTILKVKDDDQKRKPIGGNDKVTKRKQVLLPSFLKINFLREHCEGKRHVIINMAQKKAEKMIENRMQFEWTTLSHHSWPCPLCFGKLAIFAQLSLLGGPFYPSLCLTWRKKAYYQKRKLLTFMHVVYSDKW